MNYFEQITTQRYTNVQYPEDIHALMRQASQHWKDFCSLPNEVKTGLTFSNYGGYELKQGDGAVDQKENLHYSQSKRQHFTDFAATLNPQEATLVNQLIDTTDQVIDGAERLIVDFLRDVEAGLGRNDLLGDMLANKPRWVVRFLHYFPSENVETTSAAPHCDIGGFTLHLFQDYPGLQYLDQDEWKEVPLGDGLTTIFAGIQMQHRTEGGVEATCHQVIPTPESAATGRYSAVLFTDWGTGGNWDKEAFGSMSKQAPGFNYGMPHEELDSYFRTGDLAEI